MKINRFNIYVKLLCILFFLQEWNSASAALPDKVVYLYNQAVKTEDISAIMEKISDGDYTDTIALGATKVMKSAWIYLPGEVLRKDTLRNFLLIGHFESTDLYKNVNGHWEKVSSAGVYLKFSEENSSTGRYFFKLFDNSDEIADAYLVACRRFDDYVYSQIHGIPMTEAEVKNWKLEYDQTKEWFNRMTLPFWGVLLLTTILLAARYFSSRDKAYLMYAVGNSFFTANCVLLYFVDPCNIQYLPVDDPMIAVAVTGPVFVMGVGFFIFSFRYFYDKKQLEKLARQIPLWSLIACLVVSVFNTFLVYHYKILFVANIIMYTFLVVLIIIIYLVMFYHRKYAQGFPITTSFLTILYGSVFIALASIVGFVLSAVYAQNSLSLGKFHLMSFPLLIGIAIYNAFVLVAFSKRDHQISEEAHDLKIRAYEYEI